MDNAQVTGLGELGQYIQHKHNCTLGMRMGKECECGLTDTLARHRLGRSEPVGCKYPVHGSVTHVRNVECCDFCGHPADTTPLNPVAEIERLRLDVEKQEALQVSAYHAGLKAGWNFCVDDNHEGLQAAMASTDHIKELRRIREARAALGGAS